MTDDLENLDKKLEQFREKENAAQKDDSASLRAADNMNAGLRAGTELVACIGGGILLGWGVDKWLETQPLFLLLFLLAGTGAAFMNIYRLTRK